MRNLTLAASTSFAAPVANDERILAVTVDTTENTIFAVTDSGIFTDMGWKTSHDFGDVISSQFLSDTTSLVIINRTGDIFSALFTPDEDNVHGSVEVVGSVEAGIQAVDWAPDESLIAIVTADDQLILMTPDFEIISDRPVYTVETGISKPVNVGWGSKSTQFHGSEGKAAAQATVPSADDDLRPSPADDKRHHVSWRSDAAYFCVSSLDFGRRRTMRVYDRLGVLQNTSEIVPGQEHTLSFGSELIASTQLFGYVGGGSGKQGRRDVIFFERNGLRHGEFTLRCDERSPVRELLWNSDVTVLAVWISEPATQKHKVQLWTMKNYHWYLKQVITADDIVSIAWHPEQALRLLVTKKEHVDDYTFSWTTCSSHMIVPHDLGTVAVIDGDSLLLTPFRVQNVPPPMCTLNYSTSLYGVPKDICFSDKIDGMAVLFDNSRVLVVELSTSLSLRSQIVKPVTALECTITDLAPNSARQIVLSDGLSKVAVLGQGSSPQDRVSFVGTGNVSGSQKRSWIDFPYSRGRLATSVGNLWYQGGSGCVYNVDDTLAEIARFPEFCLHFQSINENTFIGLSSSGSLCIARPGYSCVIVKNCNSFSVTPKTLVYATLAHEAHFVPLACLNDSQIHGPPAGDCRKLERGSRIVVAVPSTSQLVLQMPRGNLETIYPRPFVMQGLQRDIKMQNYRTAFLTCRKHRIDFDLIAMDVTSATSNYKELLNQIPEVDFINLFLTNLSQTGKLLTPRMEAVCQGLRTEMERRDHKRYINSILTTYAVHPTPDYEGALASILELQDLEHSVIEQAVQYLIFLVDVNKLFDTALGMYDFRLVLLVARFSQKDPQEYLPFLRELRSLETNYQRFRIDDFLRRYTKALNGLYLSGEDRFSEACKYVIDHVLYNEALLLWKKSPEQLRTLMELYASWLYERKEYSESALAFINAERPRKALQAFEKGHMWKEALTVASRLELSTQATEMIALRIAENLLLRRRYSEAARVYLDYTNDLDSAINALALGQDLSEAERLIVKHSRPDLSGTILHPGALEIHAHISEEITEMMDQLRKQKSRIEELRVKRREQPDDFFGQDNPALEDVDIMTDGSNPASVFTRYTARTTNTKSTSKRTSRSKRKAERKVGSGRKGTIDEEEYILKSVSKLVTRFVESRGEAGALLPHLFRYSAEHRDAARELQKDVQRFEDELMAAIIEIWRIDEQKPCLSDQQYNERQDRAQVDPRLKIVQPSLEPGNYKIRLLDVPFDR